jgi:hypothetical protein
LAQGAEEILDECVTTANTPGHGIRGRECEDKRITDEVAEYHNGCNEGANADCSVLHEIFTA